MPVTEITLSLPAESRYVATARMTTASIAAEHDYSVQEIEGLRTGVNELVATLLEYAVDNGIDHIELIYRISADQIEVEVLAGSTESDETRPGSLDQLTDRILGSVVDEHHLGGNRGRIVKRRIAA